MHVANCQLYNIIILLHTGYMLCIIIILLCYFMLTLCYCIMASGSISYIIKTKRRKKYNSGIMAPIAIGFLPLHIRQKALLKRIELLSTANVPSRRKVQSDYVIYNICMYQIGLLCLQKLLWTKTQTSLIYTKTIAIIIYLDQRACSLHCMHLLVLAVEACLQN